MAPSIGFGDVGRANAVSIWGEGVGQAVAADGGLDALQPGHGGGDAGAGTRGVVQISWVVHCIFSLVESTRVDVEGFIGGGVGSKVGERLLEEGGGGARGIGVGHADVDAGLGIDAGVADCGVPRQGHLHALRHNAILAVEEVLGAEGPLVGIATDDGDIVDCPHIAINGTSGTTECTNTKLDTVFICKDSGHGVGGMVGGKVVDFAVDTCNVDFAGVPAAAYLIVDKATVVVLCISLGEMHFNQLGIARTRHRGQGEVGVEVAVAGGLFAIGEEHEAVILGTRIVGNPHAGK